MVGSTVAQTFSHNTRLSSSAMKKESAPTTRSNSGDSSSCLTGSSPRSSDESSSGGRAKRESSPELQDGKRPEASGKGGPVLKGRRRFVGVRQRPSGRWVSEIKDTTQKIRLWLGTFDTAEDAARAYDEAAWLLRGANTRTNFVVAPSKADNSALPSKAARLLLLRKNAIAAADAAAKPGSENTSKQPQHQKVQSLSESLMARAAEPQRATPLSIHFLPPAIPMPGLTSFQQQRTETNSGSKCGTSVMTNSSTPPCSVSSNSSYDRRDMRFSDSSSSATHCGGRNFRSSMDLRSVKTQRSPPSVTLDHTRMVVEEACEVEMKPRIGATNAPELSSSNISSCRFSVAEEMSTRELGIHQSREKSYDNCDDGVREKISRSNSAVGFQVQGTTPQDHNNSTPLAQQESFDTDISSGLSGLEDVDLGCVDSDLDFSNEISMACPSSDMYATIHLSNFLNGNAPTFPTASGNGGGDSSDSGAAGVAHEDSEMSTERMRQMMFGRQLSGGLYAMNGVQECLMLYNSTPAPYCMSSPTLSLPPSFGKCHSHLPSKNSNTSQGWVSHTNSKGAGQFTGMGGNLASTGFMNSNVYSDPGAFSSTQQSDYRTTNNVVGEHPHGINELPQLTMGAEGPSPEALWNSWDLTPLCPVI